MSLTSRQHPVPHRILHLLWQQPLFSSHLPSFWVFEEAMTQATTWLAVSIIRSAGAVLTGKEPHAPE